MENINEVDKTVNEVNNNIKVNKPDLNVVSGVLEQSATKGERAGDIIHDENTQNIWDSLRHYLGLFLALAATIINPVVGLGALAVKFLFGSNNAVIYSDKETDKDKDNNDNKENHENDKSVSKEKDGINKEEVKQEDIDKVIESDKADISKENDGIIKEPIAVAKKPLINSDKPLTLGELKRIYDHPSNDVLAAISKEYSELTGINENAFTLKYDEKSRLIFNTNFEEKTNPDNNVITRSFSSYIVKNDGVMINNKELPESKDPSIVYESPEKDPEYTRHSLLGTLFSTRLKEDLDRLADESIEAGTMKEGDKELLHIHMAQSNIEYSLKKVKKSEILEKDSSFYYRGERFSIAKRGDDIALIHNGLNKQNEVLIDNISWAGEHIDTNFIPEIAETIEGSDCFSKEAKNKDMLKMCSELGFKESSKDIQIDNKENHIEKAGKDAAVYVHSKEGARTTLIDKKENENRYDPLESIAEQDGRNKGNCSCGDELEH